MTTEEEGPLDEELPRRTSGMDRDLRPAAADGTGRGGAITDNSTATRDGEALTGEEATPPQPPQPGKALPDRDATPPRSSNTGEAQADLETAPVEEGSMEMSPDDGEAPVATTGNRAPRTTTRNQAGDGTRLRVNNMGYEILYLSQMRFKCPGCNVTYNTHASLIRHVGASHKQLKLSVSFKCAMCDYTRADLRSTAGHYRHNHGAAVPPQLVVGSIEKACPYCPFVVPIYPLVLHAHKRETHGCHVPTARKGGSREDSAAG